MEDILSVKIARENAPFTYFFWEAELSYDVIGGTAMNTAIQIRSGWESLGECRREGGCWPT